MKIDICCDAIINDENLATDIVYQNTGKDVAYFLSFLTENILRVADETVYSEIAADNFIKDFIKHIDDDTIKFAKFILKERGKL